MDVDEFIGWIHSRRSIAEVTAAAAIVAAGSYIARDRIYLANLLIKMYGRCGGVEEAVAVFESMRRRDGFSWSLVLAACVDNRRYEQALVIFGRMERPDPVSQTTALVAHARTGDAAGAAAVFASIARPGSVACNAMVTAYARNGRPTEARSVFDAMIGVRTDVSWAALCAAYAQNGRMGEATTVVGKMPAVNLASWNCLLRGYARLGDATTAREVFATMPAHDAVSRTEMLELLALKAEAEAESDPVAAAAAATEARRLFDEAGDRDVVAATSLLRVVCRSGDGGVEAAAEVFRLLPCWSLVCLNVMLSCFARSRKMVEARELFDGMPCRDIISWSTLVNGLAESCMLTDAADAFNKCPHVDVVCSNTMLDVMALAGRPVNEAELIFDSMLEKSAVSWTTLLLVYASKGEMVRVEAMVKAMPAFDLVSFNVVLGAYAGRGHLEKASAWFATDLLTWRDSVSWTYIVAAYAEAGRHVDVFSLLSQMLLSGHLPTDATFLCVLIGCCHGGSIAGGKMCFSLMGDHGMEPSKEHYGCMVDILARAGHLADAEELIDSMPFLPNEVDWNMLLSSCKTHDDGEAAARVGLRALDAAGQGGTYVLLALASLGQQPCRADREF